MRIAIFDYRVVPQNAIGNCHRRIVEALADEHEFVVFAPHFDNPRPDRIRHVHVPTPMKPLFLLFVVYHLVAPIILLLDRLRTGMRFDLIQSVESNTLLGNLVYAHFCHQAFLRDHWQNARPSGIRRIVRWLDHALHALFEPLVYRLGKRIVVPSKGLARELAALHGEEIARKIEVIPNAIEWQHLQKPMNFDRDAQRHQAGIGVEDMAMVFSALGHFERKGLPILLEAMKCVGDTRLKLIVVGGTDSLIAEFRRRAQAAGVEQQVYFAGMHRDVRPFLWAADIFAFPSLYETFSLVSFEAAAAGLPLLVSHLHGVEDLIQKDVGGWTIDRSPEAIAEKLRLALNDKALLHTMGADAAARAKAYDLDAFVERWRQFYRNWQSS